ncbi:hypothetical protein JXM67_11150 [candidate division WOR-3 bacterium]|nr:hypothetical protein [candidate division WOR-3 bacterium]
MKKGLILAFLILGLTATPTFALSLKVAPAGGVTWALGSEIEESEIGFNAGGTVEIEVWKGFDYGLRYYYSQAPTVFTDSMLFDTLETTVSATFVHHVLQLTNTWSPGWKWVDPYVRGAAGFYLWQQQDDDGEIFDLVTVNPQDSTDTTSVFEYKGTNFGISLGGGVRIWPTDFLGFRLGVDYDLVFTENKGDFGAQDANENLLRIGGEIIFRFPIK